MADDWTVTWSAPIARIGSAHTDGAVTWGADPIERSSVRRYLEPLEFDYAMHYDPEAARRHGFTDVIAPILSTAA
jgi:N-terminal half of MaoC dehydratase